MENNTLKKISENPNLISFCNKILSYNVILENEITRYMFFASLISSDALIDEQSCKETIETANFILNNINLFMLEDDIKKLVKKYSNDALNIASMCIKDFQNKLDNINNNENDEWIDYPYLGIGEKPSKYIANEYQLEKIIEG